MILMTQNMTCITFVHYVKKIHYLRCLCRLARSVRDRPHCPHGYFFCPPDELREADKRPLALPLDKCPKRKLPAAEIDPKLLLLLLLVLLSLSEEIELLFRVFSLCRWLARSWWLIEWWWLLCWPRWFKCSVDEVRDLSRIPSSSSSFVSISSASSPFRSSSSPSLKLLLLLRISSLTPLML